MPPMATISPRRSSPPWNRMSNRIGITSPCGCPPVLAACRGTDEFASDGENVLIVPPDDGAMVASAVTRLLRDRNLRDRLAGGCLRLRVRFCHRAVARSHLDCYRALLHQEWNGLRL